MKNNLYNKICSEKSMKFKMIFSFILGLVLSTSFVYAAVTGAIKVSFASSTSELSSTNVQDAIDEIYDKYKQNCPDGKICYKKICRRATKLHTEICSNSTGSSYYCRDDGFQFGSRITYGTNEFFSEKQLKVGAAFDCDVNGDGVYDSEKERFYYVRDYFDTRTKETDNNYATLIYYNNVKYGVATTDPEAIIPWTDQFLENNYFSGPKRAKTRLPTTKQWSNVSLYNSKRQILTGVGGISMEHNGVEKRLDSNFDYSEYSARLLTFVELGLHHITSIDIPKNYNFLLEGTSYSSSDYTDGYWLESPVGDGVIDVISGKGFVFYGGSNTETKQTGVRPVIEVSKQNIDFEYNEKYKK